MSAMTEVSKTSENPKSNMTLESGVFTGVVRRHIRRAYAARADL
jgi:hypothetical protein